MNVNLAARLARYSALAYRRPYDVAEAVKPFIVRFFDRDGTQAYGIVEPELVAVVFRGTQVAAAWSWADVKANILLDMDPWGPGGRAHRGYQAALAAVAGEIGAWLALFPDRAVVYAGHSLGGACATLYASWRPAPAYTFGSPRVGDAAFGATLAEPLYRFVHALDIAPRFPPPLAYRHAGERWHLARDGRLRRGAAWWPDWLPVPVARGLFDHRISEYRDKLKGVQV